MDTVWNKLHDEWVGNNNSNMRGPSTLAELLVSPSVKGLPCPSRVQFSLGYIHLTPASSHSFIH